MCGWEERGERIRVRAGFERRRGSSKVNLSLRSRPRCRSRVNRAVQVGIPPEVRSVVTGTSLTHGRGSH